MLSESQRLKLVMYRWNDMEDPTWRIAALAQLAMLLEVSAPKPGNVNRLRRFSDTAYRHFLATIALTNRGMKEA
ncbi:hypothetical protein EU546_04210, partial [Candidatus Thorarchaeota archaeon]